ncbi:rhodanese domain-containing protein CG4456 [Episyrphus balteatus]|uniref:rhodanese domain-containing protein CG4456 n=1 Tax=Episyrphus balteatus TaxID=286459 RepID=UPI002485EB96|nr:rhodanese domain-containing protein CG4456 [Episyrphus balteatus]
MLPSTMSCLQLALRQRGGAAVATTALRSHLHHHQLIRNLFILSVTTGVCNSVKANSCNVKTCLPVFSQFATSIMNANANQSYYCTRVNIPVVDYAEVKDLPNHPEKLLIDVREPNEIKGTGLIPTAINIPLGIVDEALAPHVSSKEFQRKYGRAKPDNKTYIIMQCRSGKRSQNAAEMAAALGYKNVHNYSGSWLDWAEREGLPLEPTK